MVSILKLPDMSNTVSVFGIVCGLKRAKMADAATLSPAGDDMGVFSDAVSFETLHNDNLR